MNKPLSLLTLRTAPMAVLLTLLLALPATAAMNVTITNLTSGNYFTPLFVTAHHPDVKLFQVGQQASGALQAIAEGGDISGLSAAVGGPDMDTVENPASGMLAPGQYTTFMLDPMEGNIVLSLAAMLLPTNDAFVGLDSLLLPTEPGTYTYYLNAYDAGTEANDELMNTVNGGVPGVAGIPGAPGGDAGSGGTGVTTMDTNAMVHIHRGVLGDSDPNGGMSDLDNAIHRWLNPVAMLTIVVE